MTFDVVGYWSRETTSGTEGSLTGNLMPAQALGLMLPRSAGARSSPFLRIWSHIERLDWVQLLECDGVVILRAKS